MKGINKFRNLLYRLSRALGDLNAVKKGKIGHRLGRRAIGRFIGRIINKLFK